MGLQKEEVNTQEQGFILFLLEFLWTQFLIV